VQPDKDVYRLLRVALKARILFPDLRIVIAAHVVDEAYAAPIRRELGAESGVHLIERPATKDLADLYCAADVFVTAATSHFETFGRAPAEALASGTPVIAPRFAGFAEVLDQPGGTLVDVERGESGPQASEDAMLRAVYHVLSRRRRVPASRISMAAHCRFARSHTIGLLSHVMTGMSAPTTGAVEAMPALALPRAWQAELTRLSAMAPDEALYRVWTSHGVEDDQRDRLSAHDTVFVDAVRQALCVRRRSAWRPCVKDGQHDAA
jgi:hypothetical protein